MKNFIQAITKEAGKRAFFYFRQNKNLIALRGTSKEITTNYDKKLDDFLIKEIQKKYPSHSILSEESGWIKKNLHYLWVIDSLDGSGNFANKNPLFSICVCFLKDKNPVLATVYAPVIDEFYFSQKGKGAYLNKKRIGISKIKQLKNAYVVFCEGNEKRKKRINAVLSQIYPKVKDLRKIGSAGLETAWLASGRVDAYFTFKIDPWDILAGSLIVKEAGGKFSGFKKEYSPLKRQDLVFANLFLFTKIKKLLK